LNGRTRANSIERDVPKRSDDTDATRLSASRRAPKNRASSTTAIVRPAEYHLGCRGAGRSEVGVGVTVDMA
jgi:hypothetical protein